MQKVMADPTLRISRGDFEKPVQPLSVQLDCDKFEKEAENQEEEFEIMEF
jgi:penicillin-binding protein 1A